MNKAWPFLALLAVAFVAGCAELQPLPTPSGKPEVVIHTTDAGRIKDALVLEFGSQGHSLVQDTTYSFVFTKTMQGKDLFGYRLAMGSNFGGIPHFNLALTIAPLPSATQVFAHQTMISRAAFSQPREADIDKGERGRAVQQALEKIKANVEAAGRTRKHP